MNPLVHPEAQRVGALYGLTADDVLEPRRGKSRDEARAIVAWVLRQRFGFSYPELGRFLGRDHTSIMSSVKRVEKHLREQPDSILSRNATRALAAGLATAAE